MENRNTLQVPNYISSPVHLDLPLEKKPQFFMGKSRTNKINTSRKPLETKIENKSKSSIRNYDQHSVDLSHMQPKKIIQLETKIENKSQYLIPNYDPLMIPPKKTITFWNPFFSGIFYLPSPPGLSLSIRRVTFQ